MRDQIIYLETLNEQRLLESGQELDTWNGSNSMIQIAFSIFQTESDLVFNKDLNLLDLMVINHTKTLDSWQQIRPHFPVFGPSLRKPLFEMNQGGQRQCRLFSRHFSPIASESMFEVIWQNCCFPNSKRAELTNKPSMRFSPRCHGYRWIRVGSSPTLGEAMKRIRVLGNGVCILKYCILANDEWKNLF